MIRKSRQVEKLAVAYYRMSTDKQDTSIADQRGEVQRYAALKGYTIVKEYFDEGISGDATAKRKQFQQMLADAQGGSFGIILCWDVDRFGRFDSIESGFVVHPLRQAGIRLVTVAQGVIDWDSFAGRIMHAVTAEGKHQFLRDLSKNVSRGMLARAREGKRNGAKAPYGYKLLNQELVIADDETPETVRYIFKRYVEDAATLQGITRELNAKGIPSSRGRAWAVCSIKMIVTNPCYCGRMVWNRMSAGKYNRVEDGGVVERGHRGTYYLTNERESWVEGQCPAIVSEDLWEQAQILLKQRGQPGKRARGNYTLSGTVCCGHCGAPMDGMTSIRGRKAERGPRITYRCRSGNLGLNGCRAYQLREDAVLPAIARKIVAYLGRPGLLDRLAEKIRGKAAKVEAGRPNATAVLRRQLATAQQKLDAAAKRILQVPDALVPEISRQMLALQQERDGLTEKLATAGEARQAGAESASLADQAIRELKNLERNLSAGGAHVADLIRRSVAEVKVWFEPTTPYGKQVWYMPCRGEFRLKAPNPTLSDTTAFRLSFAAPP
jgi:DNA invertase Pin-like site-specific DNA recombinase